MILADLQSFFGQGLAAAFLLFVAGGYGFKKLLGTMPDVSDAAKKAGTKKAIDLIGKFLK